MCYFHVKYGWRITWSGIEGDILAFILANNLPDWEKMKVSRSSFQWNPPIPCPGIQARLGDHCQSWILYSRFYQHFKEKTDCCCNRTYYCFSSFFPLKIFVCYLWAFLLSTRILSYMFWPSIFVLQLTQYVDLNSTTIVFSNLISSLFSSPSIEQMALSFMEVIN